MRFCQERKMSRVWWDIQLSANAFIRINLKLRISTKWQKIWSSSVPPRQDQSSPSQVRPSSALLSEAQRALQRARYLNREEVTQTTCKREITKLKLPCKCLRNQKIRHRLPISAREASSATWQKRWGTWTTVSASLWKKKPIPEC